MKKAQLFYSALDLWGFEAQALVMAEEAGEMLQALSKYARKKDEESRAHLLEELVDVRIMVDQFVQITEALADPFETAVTAKDWEAKKILRLEELVVAGLAKRGPAPASPKEALAEMYRVYVEEGGGSLLARAGAVRQAEEALGVPEHRRRS